MIKVIFFSNCQIKIFILNIFYKVILCSIFQGKRNDNKDSNQTSTNRNYPDNSNDPGNAEVTLRTDSTSQLQPTVGVES